MPQTGTVLRLQLFFIHNLRSVELVSTILEMPPASATKPAVPESTEEIVGPLFGGH